MMPTYDTIITDIRSALEAICKVITPNQNAQAVTNHMQTDAGYWTMFFPVSTPVPEESSSGLYRVDETVVLLYRVGAKTQGSDTEKEAQRLKGVSLLTFAQRPFLQYASNVDATMDGVDGIDPSGVRVVSVRLVNVTQNNGTMWGVEVTLNIPLSINLDSDFDL